MCNSSYVHDTCSNWILCNYCINVTCMCVFEIIDILLVNVQYMLQSLCVKFVFLCVIRLVIARICTIVAPTQLVCMFWKSSTF